MERRRIPRRGSLSLWERYAELPSGTTSLERVGLGGRSRKSVHWLWLCECCPCRARRFTAASPLGRHRALHHARSAGNSDSRVFFFCCEADLVVF